MASSSEHALTLAAAALMLLFAPVAMAAGPVGELTVDCTDGARGWAIDPDDPNGMIDVHVYFDGPAGDPAATAIAVTANLTVLAGQGGCRGTRCTHGFVQGLPLSRLDNLPHTLHAYGIDAVDPNLELSLSPASYTCPPLAITEGVKRHIVSPTVLGEWGFSTYFDLMLAGDLELAAVSVGVPVDAAPQLVVAEGTTRPLWLVDQGFRRVVSAEALVGWRFTAVVPVVMPAAELSALPEGTALPARPVLLRGTGPEVYLLDAYQCLEDDSDPACAEPDDSGTGTGGAGSDDSSSASNSGGSSGDSDDTTAASGGTGATSGAGTGDPSGGPGGTGGAQTSLDTGTGASETDAAGSDDDSGCGCQAPARKPGAWWLLLLVGLGRRRR